MLSSCWRGIKAEAVLGAPCVLEPSFAAFKLDYRKTAAYQSYVGNNFSKPHVRADSARSLLFLLCALPTNLSLSNATRWHNI